MYCVQPCSTRRRGVWWKIWCHLLEETFMVLAAEQFCVRVFKYTDDFKHVFHWSETDKSAWVKKKKTRGTISCSTLSNGLSRGFPFHKIAVRSIIRRVCSVRVVYCPSSGVCITYYRNDIYSPKWKRLLDLVLYTCIVLYRSWFSGSLFNRKTRRWHNNNYLCRIPLPPQQPIQDHPLYVTITILSHIRSRFMSM